MNMTYQGKDTGNLAPFPARLIHFRLVRSLTVAARKEVAVAARRRGRWAALGVLATAAVAYAGPTPDLSIGAAQYPEADAIHLRWEQHWTLEADGTVHRREHRWTKLLNSRPIRRYADPRLDYHVDEDRLIVHQARTLLPDGTALPVPDYSYNLAAPDDVGRWPAFAGWRQQVLSFSGVQDNAVLELDYEVVTRPGAQPWISADLRVDDADPVVERVVTVSVPKGTVLHFDTQGPHAGTVRPERKDAGSTVTYTWTFTKLPGNPNEPQALPWRRRGDRLCFTTCPNATEMISTILDAVQGAAKVDEALKAFAQKTVKDEPNTREQLRPLAKKLRESFNVVNSPKTYRALRVRPASAVLRSNYGSPLEAAAVCLAAVRALGHEAHPEVAVDARAWTEEVPLDSALSGVVVVVELPDGNVYLHPRKGIVQNPGTWGHHWLLGLGDTGALRATYLRDRGEKETSALAISGKLTLDKEGEAEGRLRLRLTGGFYDPAKLTKSASQKALVEGMVSRVLRDFKVTGYTIATLSDETLEATASVASDGPLKGWDDIHWMGLGDGPAFLPDFPLPLDRSYRRTAVHLRGTVREQIDLLIELPEGWAAEAGALAVTPVTGSWGRVAQEAGVEDGTVRFHRLVEITTDTVSAEEFAPLRAALNALRAPQHVELVLTPAKSSDGDTPPA